MHKYKSLIRYEFKTLRWMMLYFALGCIGYLMILSGIFEVKKMQFFTHTGVWEIQNFVTRELNWSYLILIGGAILGLVVLVYVQHRDAKNIEVGRFLKSLPVKATRIYWVRVVCGIVTYTIPFILLVGGVVGIRIHHNDWLMNYYSLSSQAQLLERLDSIGSILLLLLVSYLVITVVYLGLMVMQYLISNRVFGIVIGAILFVIPTYIQLVGASILGWSGNPYKSQLLLWGYADEMNHQYFMNGEAAIVYYSDDLVMRLIVLGVLVMIGLGLGYWCSKWFRVEDQGKLIPMAAARWIFKGVGTLCIALLPVVLDEIGLLRFENRGMMVPIGIIGMGVVGYIVLHKIAAIGCKER